MYSDFPKPNDLTFGYKREVLTEAFERISPAPDWKMPVMAIVPSDTDLTLLNAAVIFFTGGEIAVEGDPRGFRVTSPGYYVSTGG